MRNPRLLPFFCIVLVLSSACRSDFIDLTPENTIGITSYYKTPTDIAGGVNAAYGSMQTQYNFFWLFAEVPTDNAQSRVDGANYGDFNLFTVSPTNNNLSFWNTCYRSVANINIVLDRMVSVPFQDESLKKRYEGELKFLRALTYYNLVRLFGEVPLVTKSIGSIDEAYALGRTPVELVYQQIIKDLQEAEALLPARYTAATGVGRATTGAAKTILANVYLTRRQYTNAIAKLQEIISAGTYSLLPNYADVFLATNGNNAEIIFSIQYTKGGVGEGSLFTNFVFPATGNLVPFGSEAQWMATQDLYDAFDANDLIRRNASVGRYTGPNTVEYFTRKYIDVPTARFDAENDFIVTRYADVLLMLAEALNETGKATDALPFLNQVRSRAGLPSYTLTDPVQLRAQLEKDRRLELSFEGHRWFDLLRTGRTIDVLNAHFKKYTITAGTTGVVNVQPYQLLFPVPNSEILINPDKLSQNPGYN